ncbi:hypothetical protein [Kitasatospora purpeofusca]|uniref:hypothetical protein n=1 Tax=Kitasatospora purpeofusca TaxID=67352 RepID=UPI002A59B982|nr:hypothetical protein [Kitasatospora purpeofusca]MDY0811079.1 hypothetical protein [Kitasatospora purpeofusca]
MRSLIRSVSLSALAVAAVPALLLAASPPASADGEMNFGGGAGDRGSSSFSPTAQNCEGIYTYLRSNGGVVSKMPKDFQNEWRQCASGSIGFKKG